MRSMGCRQGQGQSLWCQAMYGGNLVSAEDRLRATMWPFGTRAERVSIPGNDQEVRQTRIFVYQAWLHPTCMT